MACLGKSRSWYEGLTALSKDDGGKESDFEVHCCCLFYDNLKVREAPKRKSRHCEKSCWKKILCSLPPSVVCQENQQDTISKSFWRELSVQFYTASTVPSHNRKMPKPIGLCGVIWSSIDSRARFVNFCAVKVRLLLL